MESVVVIGCGGHAKSMADVILSWSSDINIEFYDENAMENEKLFKNRGGKYKIYPLLDDTIIKNRNVTIAIGDNKERKGKAYRFCNDNIIISVISPRAYVSPFSSIGMGEFIADAVHIGPEAEIGDFCIINSCAVIEHEVVVGNFTHISVNATICGRCKIGDNVFIGAGAVVKDKLSICSDVTVGANSVVVKDIVQPGVYVGNPAKKLR